MTHDDLRAKLIELTNLIESKKEETEKKIEEACEAEDYDLAADLEEK